MELVVNADAMSMVSINTVDYGALVKFALDRRKSKNAFAFYAV